TSGSALPSFPTRRSSDLAFHRDVGAGAHRDADLRLRQGRRVVDAVAGHRDKPALPLQPLDGVRLLIRQDLRDHLVDAEADAIKRSEEHRLNSSHSQISYA